MASEEQQPDASEPARQAGRERRELRRRGRLGIGLRRDVLPFAAGALITGAIGAVVLVLVFADGGGGGQASATPTPSGGPPPVAGEPTYTESGIGIIDIEPGRGPTPEPGQTLVAHYTGWLSDGTKFASSFDTGQPTGFALGQGQVIAAWEEGLATMKVGGKRRLLVPSELGYGEEGRQGIIPPNSDLIFDVELLEIRDTP